MKDIVRKSTKPEIMVMGNVSGKLSVAKVLCFFRSQRRFI